MNLNSRLLAAVTLISVNIPQGWAQTPTTTAPPVNPNGPVLVERVEKKEGEAIIPYEKWRLTNGLTIILHEDHSDPIVHVNVTYKVGSNREVAGRTGFAHFFEHMMFQGSEHVADEEHIKIVESVGGAMNGTTNRDRTNYFETMPSNYLETALWLESDRMGFLLDAVTQQKFEVQRNAVKNEKGEGMNRPYGRIGELVAQNLYPAGHPYSWETIGYLRDLDAANVQDLKNFFMRWYGPNNAVLTVAGDINPQATLKLIEKYFGSINRGPEVKKMRVDPFYLPANRYASYSDNVPFPLVEVIYPSVKNYDADEPALDLLSSILGDGTNSLFYKNFVKTERAIQATVANPCSELAGQFTIDILPYFGTPMDSVKIWINMTFDEFEKNGISDEQLQRAKAKMESTLIQGFESVQGKAAQLASWEQFFSRPYNLNNELARYSKVSKEDIMRVFQRYIKDKYSLTITVFPKMPGSPEEKYTEPVMDASMNSSKEYEGLTYKKPVDNFDRSKRPVPGPAVSAIVPKFYSSKFDNGLRIIGTNSNEMPVVTLIMEIEGGHLLDPAGKNGLAALTAAMMDEATQNYSSEQISAELEKLGSNISFSASGLNTTVVVTTLKKNLDATLKILEEKLLRPKFDAADFKRVKNQLIENVKYEYSDPSTAVGIAFRQLLYGADNPFGSYANGNEKSLKSIELKDIKDFYAKNYSASVSRLTIVGDVTETEVMPKLAFLKGWAAKPITFPTLGATPVYNNNQVYIVDKPNAPQSQVRIGCLAMPYDFDGEYYKAQLTNFMLGDAFNSRINFTIREEKGYSYGCYSRFSGNKYTGNFGTGGAIRLNATDSALTEFFVQMKKYRDGGITEDDVKNTRSSFTQGEALSYETSFQKAGFLNQILANNLPADFQQRQNKVLNQITKEEMGRIAQKYLPIEKMVIVVVGDKEKIKKKLVAMKIGEVKDFKLDW